MCRENGASIADHRHIVHVLNIHLRVSDLQDPVPLELTSLLQNSDNPLLHQIFTDSGAENSTTKGLSKVTVVSKFKVLAGAGLRMVKKKKKNRNLNSNLFKICLFSHLKS